MYIYKNEQLTLKDNDNRYYLLNSIKTQQDQKGLPCLEGGEKGGLRCLAWKISYPCS